MKKIFLIYYCLIQINLIFAQAVNSPYPIIFVHGINSNEEIWNKVINKLSHYWELGEFHNLNFVLNARVNRSTHYLDNVIIPLRDLKGNIINRLDNSNIYTINFSNFWNQNENDPKIIYHNNEKPIAGTSSSNESAIYKQGFALKVCIDSVLRVTGAEKVILVGHSMGGLAIREYLQRIENGQHKWWMDPGDLENGHKVARVVTISTPHLGSNNMLGFFVGINPNSEAERDLRYTYNIMIENPTPYLFSNNESIVPNHYHNNDVNCNGRTDDYIDGISFGKSYSLVMPLPINIKYTWLVSKFITSGDKAVDLDRQWLYDNKGYSEPLHISDTIMTNKPHGDIPLFEGVYKDIISITRALDEPGVPSLSYEIKTDLDYAGFITLNSNSINNIDVDCFKFYLTENSNIDAKLRQNCLGVSSITLCDADNKLIAENINCNNNSYCTLTANNLPPGYYFLNIAGNPNNNSDLKGYWFRVSKTNSSSGNFLYTIDPKQMKVHKIDLNKAEKTNNGNSAIIQSYNLPLTQGSTIDGIICDGADWYISHNSDNKIYVFDKEWKIKGEFFAPGKSGTDNGSDYAPSGLSIFNLKLWITDMGAQKLYAVDVKTALQDGNCNNAVTNTINLPQYCYSVVIDDNDIFVFQATGKISKFNTNKVLQNSSLEILQEYSIQTNQSFDRGLGYNGNIIWIGGQNTDIKAYDSQRKNLLYSFSRPGSSLGGMFFFYK